MVGERNRWNTVALRTVAQPHPAGSGVLVRCREITLPGVLSERYRRCSFPPHRRAPPRHRGELRLEYLASARGKIHFTKQ